MNSKGLLLEMSIIFILFVFLTGNGPSYSPYKEELIKTEGERLIQLLGEYKRNNLQYPKELAQLNMPLKYYPHYVYVQEKDEYILWYSPIFYDPFYKLWYDSRLKYWHKFD